MKEIRLRWTVGMAGDNGQPKEGGLWMPDNERNRETLLNLAASRNEIAGPEAHWIEERDA